MVARNIFDRLFSFIKNTKPDKTKPVLEGNPAEPMKEPVVDRQPPKKSAKYRAKKPCSKLAIRVYYWIASEIDKLGYVKPEWCSSHCGNISERVVTKSKDQSCMSGCCLMCKRVWNCNLPDKCNVPLTLRITSDITHGNRKGISTLKFDDLEPYTDIEEESNNDSKK